MIIINLENEYIYVSDPLLHFGIVNKWYYSYLRGVDYVLRGSLGEVERLTSLGSSHWLGDNPAWVLLESELGITICGREGSRNELRKKLNCDLNDGLNQSMESMKLESPFRVTLRWSKGAWLLDMVYPPEMIWPWVRQLSAVLKRADSWGQSFGSTSQQLGQQILESQREICVVGVITGPL